MCPGWLLRKTILEGFLWSGNFVLQEIGSRRALHQGWKWAFKWRDEWTSFREQHVYRWQKLWNKHSRVGLHSERNNRLQTGALADSTELRYLENKLNLNKFPRINCIDATVPFGTKCRVQTGYKMWTRYKM